MIVCSYVPTSEQIKNGNRKHREPNGEKPKEIFMRETGKKTSKKIAQQELVLIAYRKGKIKGAIIAFNYPGIGYGFRAQGDEKIEC